VSPVRSPAHSAIRVDESLSLAIARIDITPCTGIASLSPLGSLITWTAVYCMSLFSLTGALSNDFTKCVAVACII